MPKTPTENLADLWSHLKAVQKARSEKHPFTYCNKMSMFIRKQGPHKLRSKAAEAKGFGKTLLDAWLQFSSPMLMIPFIKKCCDAQTQLQNGGHHWWAPRQHEISKRSCRGFPKGLLFNVPCATWFADALQGPWQQKTVQHDKQMPFPLPHRYQLEPCEPTQNMVFSRRRSDEKGSKVGTKLPEKAEWHGCNHQNGEASQIGHAFLLEQMLNYRPLSREGWSLTPCCQNISLTFHRGFTYLDFTWETSLERRPLRDFTWDISLFDRTTY